MQYPSVAIYSPRLNQVVPIDFVADTERDLTFVINFNFLPGSFDFLWQIQNMLITARIGGYNRPRVMFKGEGFRPLHSGRGHAVFLDGVIRPLLWMFDIEEVGEPVGQSVLTLPYNPSGAASFYRATGVEPTPWRVAPEARVWAEPYRGAVTITLRQCAHYPSRNSNMSEWVMAAKTLEDRGERVLFIPDTEQPYLPLHYFPCLSEAALDLQKRAALYQVAKANLFIANGPGGLCICMPHIPCLYIVTQAAVEQFETEHRRFAYVNFSRQEMVGSNWKLWLDVDKGEPGMNYQGPQQLWLWDEDTRDVIVSGFDRICMGGL